MDFVETLWLFITTRWLLSLGIALSVFIFLILIFPPLRRWFSLKWDDFGVVFPVVGLIARASNEGFNAKTGLTSSEEKLCSVYKKHIPILDKTSFLERVEYLKLSCDLGRHTTPFFIWLILAVLVIAEALGFSYMLGKWMAMEASENTHVLLMFAIVTVICVIMVALTHFAGAQTYKTNLLRSFNRDRNENNKQGEFTQIALSDTQEKDITAPSYQRTLNRIARHSKDKGSYLGLWITFIAIFVIATASTWMRYKALEQELTRETILQKENQAESSDPFAMELPDEITEPQQAADKKALVEIQSAMRQEGMAAFIMLAFIFIITQIVGIGAGYKYSLAGNQSKKALKETIGFESYEAYLQSLVFVRDLANQRLKALQAKLESESNSHRNLHKTFDDYLEYQKAKTFAQMRQTNEHTPQIVEETPPTLKSQEEEKPAVLPSPQTIDNAPNNDNVPSFEEIKAHLELLNDRDKEIVYYRNLPESAKTDELKAFLKERKEAREEAELF